jgi:ParB family chromosome partitioning protein
MSQMSKNKSVPTLKNVNALAGQGLNGLFSQSADESNWTEIPLSQITLWKNQPRSYFSEAGLQKLASSVRKQGVNLPLLVRPKDGLYEVIAGERRYRAAKKAELVTVPVIIREMNDEVAMEASLSENLDREDLNPVEVLESLLNLLAVRLDTNVHEIPAFLYQMKHTWEKGKKESGDNVIPNPDFPKQKTVQTTLNQFGYDWYSFTCNQLKLRNLPSDIYEAIATGKIEYTKGLKLKTIKDERLRQQLLQKLIEEKWSLTQLKEHLKLLSSEQVDSNHQTPQKRLSLLTNQLKKSQLWKKDKKTWKKVENYLNKIESLMTQVNQDDN